MPKEPSELLENHLCGGIPALYLRGGETPSERMALQAICVEKGRQPHEGERQQIRGSEGAQHLAAC